MAGVSEARALALHRQGAGFAKHLGVKRGTDRWNAVVYGTKRKGGWQPSFKAAAARQAGRKR
jgi:hypothetical protein